MKCNLTIEILFKYYPCTYNTILLKVWWSQNLGHTPNPSVSFFCFKKIIVFNWNWKFLIRVINLPFGLTRFGLERVYCTY